MAKLKMKKSSKSEPVKSTRVKNKTVKTVKVGARKIVRISSTGGAPRECGVCHKLGHNRRSHEPGGRLFRK